MRLSLAVAALCVSSLAAHADIIQTFNASGSFQDGATLSGTLTIDTTIGVITQSALVIGSPDSLTFSTVEAQSQSLFGSPNGYGLVDRDLAANVDFDFDFTDGGTLVGFTGGTLLGGNLFDLTTSTGYNGLLSGVVTAATPEPSSLALLGTGLLGALGIARKRFS